jgi:arsenite methyltransferase
MTSPTLPNLGSAIEERYAALASTCDSLSCGGALTFAKPQPGEVLVDLGCGRGREVIRAAELVGPLGKSIGVDRTQAMIDKARADLPRDLTNVELHCCDLARLDLCDGSAHVVISDCAINHAIDKTAVYREIHRILRPGGRFVVSDIVAEHALPAQVRNDPAAWAACYGGAIPESQYLGAVRSAGFDAVEVMRRSEPYRKSGVLIRSLTIRGYR